MSDCSGCGVALGRLHKPGCSKLAMYEAGADIAPTLPPLPPGKERIIGNDGQTWIRTIEGWERSTASPTLPTDAAARKAVPIATGFLLYFPDAVAAVAELSRIGNDQHNPGKPLHWDRSKSGDEIDALSRHLLEAGTIDTDGVRHSAKVAWRAMAMLQKEIEAARAS